MKISIIIPTHNRPDLLPQAIDSVIEQSYKNWEIVIVDDASEPPVTIDMVPNNYKQKVIIVRHESSLGVAITKNEGVKNATGDLCLFLDDDDLLANNALSEIVNIKHKRPEIDILFLNVEPFGELASGTKINQEKALKKIIDIGSIYRNRVIFEQNLFMALLASVPIAFQRPVFSCSTWNKIGGFRVNSYLPEPEWAIKASLKYKCELILDKLYFLRVDGQNLYSNSSQVEKHQQAIVETRLYLIKELESSQDEKVLKLLKNSLADSYFNRAWNLIDKDNKKSLMYLYQSFKIKKEFRHLKMMIKLFYKLTIH